jgi:serine O-acetyltransferase
MMTKTSAAERAPIKADLAAIVDELCSGKRSLVHTARDVPCAQPLPSRDAVIAVVEDLRAVLFPGYFGTSELNPDNLRFHVGHTLDGVSRALREQIKRGLCFTCGEPSRCPQCQEEAERSGDVFLSRLPELQRRLATDVQAAFEGDPAARSPDEAIFCYPGMMAITNFRVAHELHLLGVPLLPRMITEHAHSITGIDIHPGAEIGDAFFIDHGTGVVIGETCVIGRGVRIYQGVTLGAKSFPLDKDGRPIKGIPRHPIIEDDVIIYAGATILGRVTIGAGSVIGGNVWLTHGVPPGSRVAQQQVRPDAGNGDGGQQEA